MVMERAAYIGDTHGFASKLNQLSIQTTDAIYFVGDLTGSDDMTNLKDLYIFLHQGVEIAVQNGEKDLVNQKPSFRCDILNIKTLGDAFDKMEELKAKLVKAKIPVCSDELKNKKLLEILNYSSHPEQIESFPADVREMLDIGFNKELDKIIDWNFRTTKQGIRVAMVSGNWDENLGKVSYLKKGGVDIYDDYGFIENENGIYLMAPYGVVNTGIIDQKILNKINLEKSRGTKIIMITHVPPKIDIHGIKHTDEMRQQVEASFKVVLQVQPDELVYGHVHKSIKQNHNKFVSYKEVGIDMVYCAYREIKLRV